MNNIESEVLTLAELVQYQDKSIVSHTIIKKKTGTITIFAFDKGEALSEHTASHDSLILMVEGAIVATIMDNAYRVNAGNILHLPANKPHSVRAVGRCKMLLIMIRE